MVLICLFMSISCIHAADVDNLADTNQSADIDVPVLDDCEDQDYQLEDTINEMPMLCGLGTTCTSSKLVDDSSYSNSENTCTSNESTGCDVNENNLNQDNAGGSFNPALNLNCNLTKNAVSFDCNHRNITQNAICIDDCKYGNGTVENAIFDDDYTTNIDSNLSGNIYYSYSLVASNQAFDILSYTTNVNLNIVTVPRNLDEEDEILRSLNVNHYQALDESIHRNDTSVCYYGNAYINHESFEEDMEGYNPSFTIDKYLSFNYTNAADLKSAKSGNASLEINVSFSDKLIVDDNLEYSICVNPHLIIEEPNIAVENLGKYLASRFNNNINNYTKTAINQTIIFNNSFYSEIFDKHFETIFNQELLTKDNITDDDYEDIEEFTHLTSNIGFDQNLNLSNSFIEYTVFNKCTTNIVETVEFLEESMGGLFGEPHLHRRLQ